MEKYVMFVMTNCVPGTDAEFNDWYDRIHLPDVLKVPGVVAAQRYKLTTEQRRTTRPDHGYMAAYEIETDNLQETFKIMNEGLKDVYKSPSMIPDSWAYFFKPVGKRQVKVGRKSAAKKSAKKVAAKKRAKPPVKRTLKLAQGKRAVKRGSRGAPSRKAKAS